jgi:hypothetical protein
LTRVIAAVGVSLSAISSTSRSPRRHCARGRIVSRVH